jgi:hypothetical protein
MRNPIGDRFVSLSPLPWLELRFRGCAKCKQQNEANSSRFIFGVQIKLSSAMSTIILWGAFGQGGLRGVESISRELFPTIVLCCGECARAGEWTIEAEIAMWLVMRLQPPHGPGINAFSSGFLLPLLGHLAMQCSDGSQ